MQWSDACVWVWLCVRVGVCVCLSRKLPLFATQYHDDFFSFFPQGEWKNSRFAFLFVPTTRTLNIIAGRCIKLRVTMSFIHRRACKGATTYHIFLFFFFFPFFFATYSAILLHFLFYFLLYPVVIGSFGKLRKIYTHEFIKELFFAHFKMVRLHCLTAS